MFLGNCRFVVLLSFFWNITFFASRLGGILYHFVALLVFKLKFYVVLFKVK